MITDIYGYEFDGNEDYETYMLKERLTGYTKGVSDKLDIDELVSLLRGLGATKLDIDELVSLLRGLGATWLTKGDT
jgi:hypothetical protein